MTTDPLELLTAIAKDIDFEALFSALPEDEFAALIDDRMERIAEEERIVATAQERIAKLKREAESFRGAIRIKRELHERRQTSRAAEEETKAQAATSSTRPRELMRRKRAAILRVLRSNEERPMSPEETEDVIRERGLLTPDELGAGTPIRIVMAKLAKDDHLTRTSPGQYKLAADAASENGASPRVQTESPSSLQKPPPEEVASPPAGLPFATRKEFS